MKKEKYFLIATEKWIYLMAIMVTFAICGIWHGEAWNYLFWGVLFGIYLTCSNWTEKWRKNIRKQFGIRKNSTKHVAYSIVTTLILVLIAWVFFRAASIQAAVAIITKIISSVGPVFYESPANLIYAVFGILVLFAADFNREFMTKPISLLYHKYSAIRIGTIVSMIMIILLIGVFDGGQFIYFQF
jgi:D-alanyl-lipoteichoic acid acyltransferase DltB (MBOAT superfamily)